MNPTNEYIETIESAFSQIRGRLSGFGPLDFQLALRWEKNGVPLPIIIRTMDAVHRKFQDGGRRDNINSLRYFENAVNKEFATYQSNQVGKALTAYETGDDVRGVYLDRLKSLKVELGLADLPEPLRSAAIEVRHQLAGLIQIVEKEDVDAEFIERALSTFASTFEISLVVSIPVEDREEMVKKAANRLIAVGYAPDTHPDVFKALTAKAAYHHFNLPQLTLFEI